MLGIAAKARTTGEMDGESMIATVTIFTIAVILCKNCEKFHMPISQSKNIKMSISRDTYMKYCCPVRITNFETWGMPFPLKKALSFSDQVLPKLFNNSLAEMANSTEVSCTITVIGLAMQRGWTTVGMQYWIKSIYWNSMQIGWTSAPATTASQSTTKTLCTRRES